MALNSVFDFQGLQFRRVYLQARRAELRCHLAHRGPGIGYVEEDAKRLGCVGLKRHQKAKHVCTYNARRDRDWYKWGKLGRKELNSSYALSS
jgi:hypothetical protein